MVERGRPFYLIHLLAALVLMALTSLLPELKTTSQHHHGRKRKTKPTTPPPLKSTPPSSWEQFKSLLSCRSTAPSQVHDPSSTAKSSSKHVRLSSTCGSSICSFRDVVHGNTRVVDHHSTSSRSDTAALSNSETTPLARSATRHHSSRGGGMQLPKLSGCYECQAISVEPLSRRYPRPRALCSCSECGEVFTKAESLEIHQTLRHAVSELGPDDPGRNIVEIIFKSSWQRKDRPVCTVERILKVHNTHRTVARFEAYRDAVKARALPPAGRQQRKNPRCAADGNELLRFHCTTLACSIGARGSTALCAETTGHCGVCTVIRHGFGRPQQGAHQHGVRTTASSGRAHDECESASGGGGGRRAMLVCRVIAGRVKNEAAAAGAGEEEGWYDSVAGGEECANLEELFVANPRAILPCFVVVYRALD